MTILLGADLDRTLIYSRGALRTYGTAGRTLVAVERHHDADSSWMTTRAADLLAAIDRAGTLVVPATTRTVKQFHRITLPGPARRFAIAANGGVLLVDDVPDPAWSDVIARATAAVAGLGEVWAHAEQICRPEWTKTLRTAEGLFCYAVLYRGLVPPGLVAETSAWARTRGWRVSLQGRKLYWVPETLSKGAAIAEVARRADAATVLAAGDSLLDADLLATADRAIMARHGELTSSGWTAPHVEVTTASGVLAGEQILEWAAAQPPVAERTGLSARGGGSQQRP